MSDQTAKGNSGDSLVEPIRRSFSKDEMMNEARDFMCREDGVPKQLLSDDRELWYANLGLLFHFCTELFNADLDGQPNKTVRAEDSL